MAYNKKDEDVHDAIMKVDRTAVYQEGEQLATSYASSGADGWNSSTIQQIPDTAAKMSDSSDQDRPPAVHGREVPHQ